MNKLTVFSKHALLVAALLLPACSLIPEAEKGPKEPEILTISADGSMRLMGRPIPAEDVVIYPDGYGGEKAAVKVSLEPLHPPFYRDTIIVKRLGTKPAADK